MANLHFNLTQTLGGLSSHIARASSNGVPFSNPKPGGPMILDLPLEKIRRPLMRTRANDPEKVKELMESIQQIGLRNLMHQRRGINDLLTFPLKRSFKMLNKIDVLEVEGIYYGFSDVTVRGSSETGPLYHPLQNTSWNEGNIKASHAMI
ncbi:hypothetical protein HPP92_010167 [Vanilla planifolia]|uniref:Uncharacterized protein n=1 Tax=Vanilla planifolia TaxID=51239 RepID=A0A835R1V4_VANPL|nr:hypothetical protein HPP92_010167 [Vanilla planifolia]